jgi:hypothetical protein
VLGVRELVVSVSLVVEGVKLVVELVWVSELVVSEKLVVVLSVWRWRGFR